MSHVNDNWHGRRINAGLTQEELAAFAGVSRGTVKNAEAGKPLTQPVRDALDRALRKREAGPIGVREAAPMSLIYTTADGTRIEVDSDQWDPVELLPRERAICRALLEHALRRLDGAES